MQILLATPTAGGTVHAEYHCSVVKTLLHFRAEHPGIDLQTKMMTTSMLAHARNAFASIVLNDPSYTHLLFVDSDMGFEPSLIEQMLALGKPFVGAICPAKSVDLEQYHLARTRGADESTARLLAVPYVCERDVLKSGTQIKIDRGFVPMSGLGTGILLVHRSVLEGIRARYPELWAERAGERYEGLGINGGVLQCFEGMPGPGGLYMGEDMAFCRRWTEGCGGDVWGCVSEAISHTGNTRYIGHYLHKLVHDHQQKTGSSAIPAVKLRAVS